MQHPVIIRIKPIDKTFMMSIRVRIAGHDFGYDGLMLDGLDLNYIQKISDQIIYSIMKPADKKFHPPAPPFYESNPAGTE